MKSTLKVFRYEITRNIRRRGYIFTTLGLPILIIAISIFVQWIGNKSTENQTPEEIVQQLQFNFGGIKKAGYVDSSGLFDESAASSDLESFSDQASAEAALNSGDVDAVYVIPPDYAETGKVTLVVPEITLNNVSTEPVKKLVFNALGQDLPVATLARLQNPAFINTVNLKRAPTNENAVNNEDTNFALVYGFGILFFMTIFGTNGYLMQSVIEEKENRLVEILLSSVRPTQLLSGKILALGLLGLAQVLTWIAIGYAYLSLQMSRGLPNPLASVYIPLDVLPILLIYFILGYLTFAAIFGAVGAVSNSMSEGPQLSIIFGIPIFITFYLFPSFLSSPDAALPTFLSLFPLTSPLGMIMRSVVSPVPVWQVALSVGLLVAWVVFMFWVAGKMFGVQTLLSGKVPKLRELPRLIFGRS
ncbi:MAG TPA: ABC transporter permease [Phototrophicaceae bacterium]|jgi:ABC-2 type transport system permease protein|nr:ABC transporter permease [Phototrophicaceae bacterium]